jgi:hypothetical protein
MRLSLSNLGSRAQVVIYYSEIASTMHFSRSHTIHILPKPSRLSRNRRTGSQIFTKSIMKSFTLFVALAAFGVDALPQKKGDPYATTAGQPLSADYNPMALLDKTPAWPSNFGGVKIAKGPAPSGCYPFEIIVGKSR